MKKDFKMDVAEVSRWLDLEASWFESAHGCLGETARPLSLLSAHALRLMGLTWLDGEPLELQAEARELGVYVWLHTAPLSEVKREIWSGEWRALYEASTDIPDIVRAGLRAERDRLTRILASTTITERAKPRKGKDDTPRDILAPSLLTYRLMTVAKAGNLSLEQAGWELPLVQAMQLWHAARWAEGVWTVRPGKVMSEQDAGDIGPDFLRTIDTPGES
jgi:hypothetical protein